MLPNFLHVGAAKAASTYLWTILKEHPEVFVPTAKSMDNVNFFVGSYHKGLAWYEDTYFSNYGGEKAVGETTNSYLLFEPALVRIKRDLPDVKLTMILRNPIDIAFLQWVMQKNVRGWTPEQGYDFENMLAPHAWQLFRMWAEPGFYASHLRRVYRYFAKENVLVLFYDDLTTDAAAFVRTYFDFLNVDRDFVPSSLKKVVGFPGTSGADTKDKDLETGFSAEFRAELQAVFHEDIQELQEIVGRDLSHWC